MLDVARYNVDMYTHRFTNSALIMSLGALSKPSLPAVSPSKSLHQLPPPPPPPRHRPIVKASTMLNLDSSTEVVDVANLMAKPSPPPLIQYVEIADTAGQLYCVDRQISVSCWLKIITIAKDCQSSNVLLMTTDKGVYLKTIKVIVPGEPLLLWFTENILAMLNMPYLTSINIETKHNRYICHLCHLEFDYPNNLKIHLALDCNRLSSQHLWMKLGKEFNRASLPMLSMDFFQKPPLPFSFTLSGPPNHLVTSVRESPPARVSTPTRTSTPVRISPSGTLESNFSARALLNNSTGTFSSNTMTPSPSTSTSPNSSTHTSPKSPGQMSYCSSASSTRLSPVKRNIGQRHSAFKPYNISKPGAVPTTKSATEQPVLPTSYQILSVTTPAPVALVSPGAGPVQPDAQAAHMETIASNLGKSKAGHQCIYCGKIYSRKYGLKIHIRTHTGYKPLKCKFCLRPFGDPSNLNKHVRLHADGETPYRCDLCGKVLVRRRDLERHIRSRHQNNASGVDNRETDGTTDEDMDDAPEL